jgi:hypothetical protein
MVPRHAPVLGYDLRPGRFDGQSAPAYARSVLHDDGLLARARARGSVAATAAVQRAASRIARFRFRTGTLLLIAVIGQLADAVTYAIGGAMIGLHYEVNVLADFISSRAGIDGVLFAKLAVILLSIVVLVAMARRAPRAFAIGAAAAGFIGLLGAVMNAITVAHLL